MSEVRWAVRVYINNAFAYWVPANGNVGTRLEYKHIEDAWIDVWQFRKVFHDRIYRVCRITRKPRLSPETKAARDALCAAAVDLPQRQCWCPGEHRGHSGLCLAATRYQLAVRK